MSADQPLTGDELATIKAERAIACDDGPEFTWHQRQDAIWALLDDGGWVERLVAEIERLRALPDLTLGWDSRQGVLVFTDVNAAKRVTLREWVDGP